MQIHVSGHFQLTLHVGPGSDSMYIYSMHQWSLHRPTYWSQAMPQTKYWTQTYCCPDDLFLDGEGDVVRYGVRPSRPIYKPSCSKLYYLLP